MPDPLQTALHIAASGLQAQSMRLRVVSENIANAQSTGSTPGAVPYARQTVSFESEMDRTLGANLVEVKSIGVDSTPLKKQRDPGKRAAVEKRCAAITDSTTFIGAAAFAADRSRDPRQGGRRLSRDCANDDLIGVSRQVRFGVEAEDAE
jgi:flagellar basal body rod protein FlgB